MSHLFQRPLCEMGAAYDFAFRPLLGEGDPTHGGGCDDRPHAVTLLSATADPAAASAARRSFALCPEHESQLRREDEKLAGRGIVSRFPPGGARPGGPKVGGG
ncbi:MAG TPA: hypothetical protein VML53_05000 [Thermoplasmata archaeon]|nr:hypothetical protein [Thermoplasmata archaeon]